MNAPSGRMKASELIQLLQVLIDQHGNQYVYCGGEDYPGPVAGAYLSRGDSYTPAGSFKLHTD